MALVFAQWFFNHNGIGICPAVLQDRIVRATSSYSSYSIEIRVYHVYEYPSFVWLPDGINLYIHICAFTYHHSLLLTNQWNPDPNAWSATLSNSKFDHWPDMKYEALNTSPTRLYYFVWNYSIRVLGWLLECLNSITAPGSVSDKPFQSFQAFKKNPCYQLEKSHCKLCTCTLWPQNMLFWSQSTFHYHTTPCHA